MSSSYLCENCGIKVSESEDSQCPGCGHVKTEGIASSEPTGHTGNLLQQKQGGSDSNPSEAEAWSTEVLRECEILFDYSRPMVEQEPAVAEANQRIKAKLPSAPNNEAASHLYSYLGEINRRTGQYSQAYEAAVKGVESQINFYKFQSHNSILESLCNLENHQDFTLRYENAVKDAFPEADYHLMNYMLKIYDYEGALGACEKYFTHDISAFNYNRASILISAGNLDESEQILNKLIANGPKNDYFAASVNTLVFGILNPLKRYVEAEKYLVNALCTPSERERINAYSNLAMIAYDLGEFNAAKRYAKVASNYSELGIASESRLTLCRIEHQKLTASANAGDAEWSSFLHEINEAMKISDFTDVPNFLRLLISAASKSKNDDLLVEMIEDSYKSLTKLSAWKSKLDIRNEIEALRVETLSDFHFKKFNYRELDEIFIAALGQYTDRYFPSLLEYLRTPFAPLELRRMTLKNTHVEFLSEWSSFETQAEILYELAKNREESILLALARNPNSPDEVCQLIARVQHLDLDFALSTREVISKDLLKNLVASNFDSVRKEIARRENLDDDVYRILAIDTSLLVRDAIRENSSCSAEIRALAALGSL